MPRRLHILILSFALALASCVKNDCEPGTARVLLVYMGGDNNLSNAAADKLTALREGWHGIGDGQIVAYLDRPGGAQLVEFVGKSAAHPLGLRTVEVYAVENSACADVFGRVIQQVRERYPADSYGLLVFSHASGWLPQGVFNQFGSGVIPQSASTFAGGEQQSRSIIVDGADEMDLKEFAAAIPDGVFDYIVFEACFMAGIEVAYELRHKTPYILASSAEIVDPGFTPAYPSAMAGLFRRDLAGFGRSVFDHTLTYAESDPQRSATYSVIKTAALEPLAAFVRQNCDLQREVDIAGIQRFDRLQAATLFFDFEDYYGRLVDTDARREELGRLIADCVKWKAATPGFMNQTGGYNGFAINSHSGLTAYIPQVAFPGLNAAYQGLQWAEAIR